MKAFFNRVGLTADWLIALAMYLTGAWFALEGLSFAALMCGCGAGHFVTTHYVKVRP